MKRSVAGLGSTRNGDENGRKFEAALRGGRRPPSFGCFKTHLLHLWRERRVNGQPGPRDGVPHHQKGVCVYVDVCCFPFESFNDLFCSLLAALFVLNKTLADFRVNFSTKQRKRPVFKGGKLFPVRLFPSSPTATLPLK